MRGKRGNGEKKRKWRGRSPLSLSLFLTPLSPFHLCISNSPLFAILHSRTISWLSSYQLTAWLTGCYWLWQPEYNFTQINFLGLGFFRNLFILPFEWHWLRENNVRLQSLLNREKTRSWKSSVKKLCRKVRGIYKNSYHVDLDLERKSRICCCWMAVDGVFRISQHFIRP